jgi:hypothetical protein
MIHLSDRIPDPQRVRAEVSAAWEHLLTAAQEAARQVGDTSRSSGSVARDRVALARLALHGELRFSRWRWAGAGLAAGVIIGAVAAALARRARHAALAGEQQPHDATAAPVLDKARTATAAVGERTSTAAQHAAEVAREAAGTAGP